MAAVMAVYGFRIRPGRFDEWRALSREGEKLITRVGGGAMRAFMPALAGAELPFCYATIEFDSGEQWGRFTDAAANELEAQVLNERMFGHDDSPTEMLSTVLATEIPMPGTPRERGPVSEVFVSRARPGRFADTIAFGAEAAGVLVRHGAVGVRQHLVGPAGSESGRLAFTAEFENAAAYGRLLDSIDEPDMQDLMMRIMAVDCPFEILQHTVYTEISLV
jgi:hypothetical protein